MVLSNLVMRLQNTGTSSGFILPSLRFRTAELGIFPGHRMSHIKAGSICLRPSFHERPQLSKFYLDLA